MKYAFVTAFAVILVAFVLIFFTSGESFTGSLLPELIGFSLDGLLFIGVLSLLQRKRDRDAKRELKQSLEIHTTLLIEAIKSGNPFHWSKHAMHASQMAPLKEYANTLYQGLENNSVTLGPLQIKAFIETADEIYETLVGLFPVAAQISSKHLAAWSSVVSTIRLTKNTYLSAKAKHEAGEPLQWQKQSDLALTIKEFLTAAYYISNEEPRT
ncbi:hypothetical protein [Stutzerimonas stutzeri]|uniref:DUF4760 domain-containing protein n=1 Tax=Stutzerimonas stutzeri TaxID=316 RepID=A0A172WLA8_STUST|nr:hypothetical protein [Stutzerimonas stutzeri]ANF24197.1 hypothetical protein PS273GM_03060 [Stutzerimonas stutzeri]